MQAAALHSRYRKGAATEPNLRVFQSNLRHFKNKGAENIAFGQSGFENSQFPLSRHAME